MDGGNVSSRLLAYATADRQIFAKRFHNIVTFLSCDNTHEPDAWADLLLKTDAFENQVDMSDLVGWIKGLLYLWNGQDSWNRLILQNDVKE